MSHTQHIPVMLEEVLEVFSGLSEINSPTFLDCTLGGGGHSQALLEKHQELFLVGTDRDPKALERAKARLASYASRTSFFEANFSMLADEEFRATLPRDKFNGVLLDLGISSDQLNNPERGFSFSVDGPLDMRMGQGSGPSAADILNSTEKDELKRIFLRGGVGKFSRRLAELVVDNRPIQTTKEFAQLCEKAVPSWESQNKNPATLPFQAIRIEVNSELDSIEKFLGCLPSLLSPGGRLAAISFHSLEDQVVTSSLRNYSRRGEKIRKLPSSGEKASFGKLLSKQAITPSDKERESNPRARSARMRVFERGK